MNDRKQRLMPDGEPKYIRCYSNLGLPTETADCYTIVFTGRYPKDDGEFMYLASSPNPFHPQGFGQHGYSHEQVDVNQNGWAPAIGWANHLGMRIPFKELSEDAKRFVVQEYKLLWKLEADK